MALTDGIIVQALDDQGRLKTSPNPEIAATSLQYAHGNLGTPKATLGVATQVSYTLDAVNLVELVGVVLLIGPEAISGDFMFLDVLAPDGTTVVGSFGNFGVLPNTVLDLSEAGVKKDIPADFKIRLTYNSTGAADVSFAVNYKFRK